MAAIEPISVEGLDFSLAVEDLPEVLRDLDNLDDLVLDEMTITMRRAIDILEAAVVQRTPVGVTGDLRRAWGTNVQRGQSAVKGILANPMQYAPVVEKGRRPKKPWPPEDAIELWVRRKLKITKEKEVKAVVFLIRRKIGKKGIEGQHMAEEGLKAVKGQIEADFEGIPARVARRFES